MKAVENLNDDEALKVIAGAKLAVMPGAALVIAVKRRLRKTIAELIPRCDQAALQAVDVHGNTALIWAAYYGRAEVCAQLIPRYDQAALQAKDYAGKTALDYAEQRGLTDVCAQLRARCRPA